MSYPVVTSVRDFPLGKSSQERPNVMIRVFWDIRGTGSRREDVVDLGGRERTLKLERGRRRYSGASGGRERRSERGGDGLELERAIGSA